MSVMTGLELPCCSQVRFGRQVRRSRHEHRRRLGQQGHVPLSCRVPLARPVRLAVRLQPRVSQGSIVIPLTRLIRQQVIVNEL